MLSAKRFISSARVFIQYRRSSTSCYIIYNGTCPRPVALYEGEHSHCWWSLRALLLAVTGLPAWVKRGRDRHRPFPWHAFIQPQIPAFIQHLCLPGCDVKLPCFAPGLGASHPPNQGPKGCCAPHPCHGGRCTRGVWPPPRGTLTPMFRPRARFCSTSASYAQTQRRIVI